MRMDFISFVNYANGNHSSSVFAQSEYKDEVQELLKEWDAYSDITSIYVLPYDADEFPNGDGDRAGEFFSIHGREGDDDKATGTARGREGGRG